MHEHLETAMRIALDYLDGARDRAVFPDPADVERLAAALDGPVPAEPQPVADMLALLANVAAPATVANAGSRYFGFVNGGAMPATTAASWISTAWDQNAGMRAGSPAAELLEAAAFRWAADVLGVPATGGGFVTGATMANLTCLAAARHRILDGAGWDVGADGLFGAPPVSVVVGDEVHVSLLKALSVLGMGAGRVHRVPVDDQGRLDPHQLPPLDGRTIVCLQAGNVNSGASDPFTEIIPTAREAGAWVHVDGAFGLWANAAPGRAHLVDGVAGADSWATDAHKWLNVPYDCGIAMTRDVEALHAAMTTSAAYLGVPGQAEPHHNVPEMSRRARGIEVWAAIHSLGRSGIGEMVERACRLADRFAVAMAEAGFEVLNDVVLNQVLVSFGSDETTDRIIQSIQAGGIAWMGGTTWQGHRAMRFSVSNWQTTETDIDVVVGAVLTETGRLGLGGGHS